jgi:dipeptidyl aminopeptidase/acylaminoacyl peptidase
MPTAARSHARRLLAVSRARTPAFNSPIRFKCHVVDDGNLDERSAHHATEKLWFLEWEHHGTPWESPEGYSRHNPIDCVGRWKTPTLVVHAARDYRVVESQGMSTFTALQRHGIPSRLLYFPDENHWVVKPQNSLLGHQTVLDWRHRWIGSEAHDGANR